MLAVRWHGRRDLRLEDIPEPQVKPGFIKIKVKACGICGTDLNEYLNGPIFIPTEGPHPLTGRTAPVTIGHEFAGEVVEIGEGVKGFEVGDRVAVFPVIHCGECYFCRRGMENLCVNFGVTGLSEDGVLPSTPWSDHIRPTKSQKAFRSRRPRWSSPSQSR